MQPPSADSSPHERALDHAAWRFNAQGMELSTHAEFAEQLGGVRRAIYSPTEEHKDLLFQVYQRSFQVLVWHLRGATRRRGHPLKVVRSLVATVLNPARPEIAAPSAIDILPPARGAKLRSLHDALVAELAAVLAAGAQAGQVRDCDFPVAARAILGLILWTPVASHRMPPTKLFNRPRVIEALQDLLTYGRAGDRSVGVEAPRLDLAPPGSRFPASVGLPSPQDLSRERILVNASHLLNRCGGLPAPLEKVSKRPGCDSRILRELAADKAGLVRACHARTIDVLYRILEEAFASARATDAAALAFAQALAEAYLREDVQPLRPFVGLEALSPEDLDALRIRWRVLLANLRGRQVDGVANHQLRERYYDLAPLIWTALCGWLASGLLDGGDRANDHSREVAQLMRLGLAPV
ncbi:MAG: hypothetical protein JHD15_16545 [Phenylobacterium sp.]|nr:hypothetical protein [Phenylobacterium sp.]